jgi:hypothetical protein
MVRAFSDFESNIVSVERVDEYCELKHEVGRNQIYNFFFYKYISSCMIY